MPRSIVSTPHAPICSSTRSRSLTPRWSNATATLIPRYVTTNDERGADDGRARALAGAGTAATGRRGASERQGEVRPSDLVDVGRRPRRRPPRGTLPVRLRAAEEPGERPARLLEGSRVAARLRALPRGGRDLRGGVHDLPAARVASRGAPDARAAVGRRRDGLARAGAPDRRRRSRSPARSSIACRSGPG